MCARTTQLDSFARSTRTIVLALAIEVLVLLILVLNWRFGKAYHLGEFDLNPFSINGTKGTKTFIFTASFPDV